MSALAPNRDLGGAGWQQPTKAGRVRQCPRLRFGQLGHDRSLQLGHHLQHELRERRADGLPARAAPGDVRALEAGRTGRAASGARESGRPGCGAQLLHANRARAEQAPRCRGGDADSGHGAARADRRRRRRHRERCGCRRGAGICRSNTSARCRSTRPRRDSDGTCRPTWTGPVRSSRLARWCRRRPRSRSACTRIGRRR